MKLRRRGRGVRLRLRTLEGRIERQHQRIAELEREGLRVSPQLAALEARVEDLAQRLAEPPRASDDTGREEAADLLDAVRREHARVRARITAATVFEERLRALEERQGPRSGLSASGN